MNWLNVVIMGIGLAMDCCAVSAVQGLHQGKWHPRALMMAVMFLIISAVIASPFALGMVSVYSQFMQSFGKQTQLILAAPFAGQIYLVIHSVLVGLIVSIIMYGNVKKGIKFSVPLALVSYGIFYLISNFAGAMFLS